MAFCFLSRSATGRSIIFLGIWLQTESLREGDYLGVSGYRSLISNRRADRQLRADLLRESQEFGGNQATASNPFSKGMSGSQHVDTREKDHKSPFNLFDWGGLDASEIVNEINEANATGGKRVLGGYGMRTRKSLLTWWSIAVPWGSGPVVTKAMFIVLALLIFCAPCCSYSVIFRLLLGHTQESRARNPLVQQAVDSVSMPLKGLLFFGCCYMFISILRQGAHGDYPLLDDIKLVLGWGVQLSVVAAPLRVLSNIDRALHRLALDRVTNRAYLKRKEMMSAIARGSHIVGPTLADDELGYFLYNYVWRPFYIGSTVTVLLFILLEAFGSSTQTFTLLAGYTFVTFLTAVFGARTLGPDLYGGVVLFFEKPFVEGDIITLDKMNSQGGAQTDVKASCVTGFVERIGLRSTTVRRFDMRATMIPNSWFMKQAVANWNTRPRKLIHIMFSVSHRTPVELCKLFQEKVLYVVKNHSGVDQQMYIKAIFRGLEGGLSFLLVCFNARGTKKQFVQQELVLTIVELARKLDIGLTFQTQSLYVEREEVSSGNLYRGLHAPTKLQEKMQEAGGGGIDEDLSALLPKKQKLADATQRFSPEGMFVVRLERLVLYHANNAFADIIQGATHKDGKADSTDEGKKKVKAYRVKMRIQGDEQQESLPSGWNQPHPSDVWCRTAMVHEDHCVAGGHEVKFFENVAFSIKDDGDEVGSIPRKIDLYAIQVSKGFKNWAWSVPLAQVGTISADLHKLALTTSSNEAQPLELLTEGGHAAGQLYVQVFLPESSSVLLQKPLAACEPSHWSS